MTEEEDNIKMLMARLSAIGWYEQTIEPNEDADALEIKHWCLENCGLAYDLSQKDGGPEATWIAMTKTDRVFEALYAFKTLALATHFKLMWCGR